MRNKLEWIILGLIFAVLLVYLLRLFNIENAVLDWLALIALSLFLAIHIYRMVKNKK